MVKRKLMFQPAIIIGISLIAVQIVFLLPPIAQNPSYHLFADRRSILGVQNGLNVISNLAFLAAGLWGLVQCGRNRAARLVFSAGAVLTAMGSAYYHYAPDTRALFWDRLPMTVCFMSLSALVVGERINERIGKALLLPLIIAGAASVIYWRMTETAGSGDLRPYILVQFLPLLILPLICVLYPACIPDSSFRRAFYWYMAAKGFEILDSQIYSLGGLASGHTLKHLAAGYACWWVVRLSRNKRSV